MNLLDWLPRWLAEDVAFGTNTFTDLVLVLVLLFAVFFGYHALRTRAVRRARAQLPLVIGGWGTRGKSGTERCKAAVLHGYGAQVFSKTSGCEAMFIHALPGQQPRELFLFRPMEKVSIWEMASTLGLARNLGAQIYLYECMALNPRYVQVIQHGWMRDDHATITNAYPDHEDIQGPAGHDVASSIAAFLPQGGQALTTEEHMLPLLQERAEQLGTRLEQVPWIDQALLTPDVLDRFPYQEHPANVALVQRLGRQLGIDPAFALKEMADHLVPDLGVLRSYPPVGRAGRCLVFSNGMSANERRAALENWRRLGLYEHRCGQDPHEWVLGLLNNRADRIARSRVFARIAVEDLPAQRWLCIGSNLSGLRQYVDEALDRHQETWSLAGCEDLAAAAQRIDDHLEGLKWDVRDESGLRQRIDALLRGGGCRPEQRETLLAGADVASLLASAQAVQGMADERDPTDCAQAWRHQEQLALRLLEHLPAQDERAAPDRVSTTDCLHWLGVFWIQLRQIASLRLQLRALLRSGGRPADLDPDYRHLLRTASRARFVFLDDLHASGDQVIEAAFALLPPGHRGRLVGMQNIKGTGLDFAYRWIDVMEASQLIERLQTGPVADRLAAAEHLAGISTWHLHDARLALAGVLRAQADPETQNHQLAAALERAAERIRHGLEAALGRLRSGQGRGRWDGLLEQLEAVLDFVDSIRRRRRYGRILADLTGRRIGHRRAAEELRAITGRQKGGWLVASLAAWRRDLEPSLDGQARWPAGLRPYDAQDFEADLAQVVLYEPQEAAR